MLKKIICLLAVLLLVFSVTVSAKEEFLVYGKDDIDLICNALDMNDCDIKDYCAENNITYLAVNSDNTKQIRRTELFDAFSKKTVDLSVLDDNEIIQLSSDISGFDGIKGTVVNQGDYKFLKVELRSEDSGGDYVLTQYTTVKNFKRIVLTFYTTGTNDRSYIEGIIKEQFKKNPDYKPYIITGVVLFALAGAVVLVFILRDFRKEKPEEQNQQPYNENN